MVSRTLIRFLGRRYEMPAIFWIWFWITMANVLSAALFLFYPPYWRDIGQLQLVRHNPLLPNDIPFWPALLLHIPLWPVFWVGNTIYVIYFFATRVKEHGWIGTWLRLAFMTTYNQEERDA
jgi:hypothetical protein